MEQNLGGKIDGLQGKITFSLNDTTCAKAVAICFLLFHHLFYSPDRYKDTVFLLFNSEGIPYVNKLAIAARVCVSIFLVLSGIGMCVKMERSAAGLKSMYKGAFKSLIKLLMNYWCIFIIFVPICLARGMQNLYDGGNIVISVLMDFLGIAKLTGTGTMNGAWWYVSVVIVSYLIAPLLFFFIKRNPFLSLSVIVILIMGKGFLYPYVGWGVIFFYVMIFAFGMAVKATGILDKAK